MGNFYRKIAYGIVRLREDLCGVEDYWHPRMAARSGNIEDKYFVDMSAKGVYPFELGGGVPLVEMNGDKRFFSITIFNYGLGLIDLGNIEADREKIMAVLGWVISNQEKDGGWHNDYDVDCLNIKAGWSSAMGQGLGVSFVYRCYLNGLLSLEKAGAIMKKAVDHMNSSSLVCSTPYGNILQEFGGTEKSVLNGYVFAVFGLYDYGRMTGDHSQFEYHVGVLENVLNRYTYGRTWTYYNLDGVISSIFYHRLHIEQLIALYHLTGKACFLNQTQRWKVGEKFRVIFTLVKAAQKLALMNSITVLDK